MKARSMVLATAVSLSLATAAYAQQEQDAAAQDTQKVDQPERSSGNGMQMDAETVRQMQQALKDKGHDPGPVDGIMGKRTRKALRDFQKAEGLEASGKPDAQTMAALGMDEGSTASSDQATGDMGAASPDSPTSQSPGTPTDSNSPAAQGSDAAQEGAGGQQSQ